ncbi:MAG: DUF4363 family protein [Heliobacteriaceae bacterium]|nr:DUF4363 family protein [Heliobacteriaceae bacterium]
MRLVIVLLLIFGAIISLGVWTTHALNTSADELLHQIEQIADNLENERWIPANTQTEQLNVAWEKVGRWWPLVLEHQEIDNIEFALGKVEEYVAQQEKTLSLGQLAELRLMINHIPEKEAVTLKNIF